MYIRVNLKWTVVSMIASAAPHLTPPQMVRLLSACLSRCNVPRRRAAEKMSDPQQHQLLIPTQNCGEAPWKVGKRRVALKRSIQYLVRGKAPLKVGKRRVALKRSAGRPQMQRAWMEQEPRAMKARMAPVINLRLCRWGRGKRRRKRELATKARYQSRLR
jgi:hypothetical protein